MIRQYLSELKERFNKLEGKPRDNAIKGVVFAGGGALILALYYGLDKDKEQPKVVPPPPVTVALGDERLEDDIRAQFSRESEEQKNRNDKLQKETDALRQELETMKKQVQAGNAVADAMRNSVDQLALADSAAGETNSSARTARAIPAPSAPGRAPNDPLQWAMNSGPSGQPLAEPKVEYVGAIGSVQIAAAVDAAGEAEKKSGRKFYLPVSYMPARTLTGLRAKTTDGADKDPEQILVRIQAPAVLPNEVKAALDGCFVVAHGYGSLASERVESRLVSLNCVDHSGRSVIAAKVKGILLDKDGVKGLSAHPVTKMGANMARAVFTSIISGAAEAYEQQSSVTSVSPLGTTRTIDTDKIGQAGLSAGVGKASAELTKIYTELARQQAPVLELGPSKEVFVFLTEGVWLEVRHYEA